MKDFVLIAIFLAIGTLSLTAQRVDTLYSDLKDPASFVLVNDAIYILESGNHRVLKLDLNGNLIDKYGNRGGSNYQFDRPKSISSSTGLKIYISDLGNNRIQVFDKRWQFLSSITGNEKFQSRDKIEPTYLAVNKLGEIFFYDLKSKSLLKYNEDGAYLDATRLPLEIKSIDDIQLSDDKIFILDKRSGLIHRLSGNGFYESFYLAEKTDVFYSVGDEIYLVEDGILKSKSKQRSRNLSNLSAFKRVNKLLVINNEVFILTDNSLLKIILPK
jgi:hypothetical protein